MREASNLVILAAGRLRQGGYGGGPAGLGAVALGHSAVAALLASPALPRPGSLIWGMARSHTQGMNPARTLALGAGLPADTPAFTVNMACGSSLQALILAGQRLLAGAPAPILVGGSEAMSDTPHLVPGLRWGFRMGHRELPDVMHQDGLRCPVTGLLMGETIERLAAKRGVARLEADAWAVCIIIGREFLVSACGAASTLLAFNAAGIDFDAIKLLHHLAETGQVEAVDESVSTQGLDEVSAARVAGRGRETVHTAERNGEACI